MTHASASPRSISPRSRHRLLAALASLPLVCAFSATALAQSSLSWSATGSSTLGGTGFWDDSATSWWNGSTAVSWPATGTENAAIFTGNAGTVTVNGALSANALNFSTNNYILDGAQVLNLNGTAPTINVASGLSATIGNNTALQLAGSSGLTKTGAGILTVNSSIGQALTGGVTVNGGTLILSLANLATPTDLVPASNTLTVGGGTVSITSKSGATGSQSFSNVVLAKGNSQIRVGHPVTGTPPAGTVTSLTLGTISRSSPGSVVRFNSAAGGFGTAVSTVDKLYVPVPAAAGWLAPWAFTGDNVTSSPRFAYADANGQIYNPFGVGASANLANVTNPANVYTATGTHTPTANVVALGIQSNGATTYNLNGVSATLGGFIGIPTNTATNFNTTGGGTIQINSGNELFTTGLGTININVPIVDNPGNASHLTHVGAGTLNLGAVNTYTGETNVIGGTLVVTETGDINTSSGIFVNAGTFRQKNFTTTLTPLITLQGGRVEGDGNITDLLVTNLAANTVANVSTSTAPLTITGNLTFQGAGSLSPLLRPDSLPYAVAGTLSTTPSVAKVTINPVAPAGGWVDGSTTYNLLSYGTWGGSLSDFVIGTASPAFSARQGATLADTGGMLTITVAGDKAVWTGAANGNWTTATVAAPFNWRTLAGANDTQFLTGDDTIFNDTALNANVVISDANVAPTSMLFNNNTLNYTISSPAGFGLSAGILTKTGTGTLTLGGTNTNTGLTTITEGSLILGSDTALQGTNSLFLGSNTATTSGTATLDLNGFNARVISVGSGTATTNTITNNGAGSGTNTLTLTLPTTALTSLVTDGPTRKTALSLGARAGNPTNANNTFSGGFLMYGASGGGEAAGCRLSPVAANNPTIEGGVVTKGTYGTGTITVGLDPADKAQFYFNAPNVKIGNNLIINSALGTDIVGGLRVEDYGIEINGSVVLNKAGLTVHHNGQFSSGPSANPPLEQGSAVGGQVTFYGPILAGENPAAGLTIQQANVSTTKRVVAILANSTPTPSDYTGNTTLSALNVTLRLAAANQIPDGTGKGNVVFAGNATLDLNDFSETVNGLSGAGFVENLNGVSAVTLTVGAGDATGNDFSGRIFDARGGATVGLTKIGTGTQILSNGNVYTGTTTISAGTLQLGNGGTTGSLLPASAIVNTGTLAFNRSNAVVQGTDFSGSPLTGTGGLTQLGTGTLELNTANTYTGPTLISAGTLIASGGASFGATKVTMATGSTFALSSLSAASLTLTGGLAGSGSVNADGKTLIVGGTFEPGALAVTGNFTLASGTATTLLATASPATSSAVTVSGSVVNAGTLIITPGSGFTFAADNSFTFFTAASITRGFTAVSVGSVALTASSGGIWTGSGSGLAYSYDENTATLTVANASSLTPLQEWRLTNLGTSENTGEAADAFDKDNDGLPNLLEYALGGNPNVANASVLPVAGGGNPLTLTFTRLADPAITYVVEASDTLDTGSWSSIFTSTGIAGSVTVTDPGPVVGNRRFLRLRVTTN